MIDHVWSVLCNSATIDRESNNVTLFQVVEQLNVSGPSGADVSTGVAIFDAELVTLWSRTNLDHPARSRARIQFVAPDGALLGKPILYDVDLTGYGRLRNRTRISGFPVRGPGKYEFRVELEKDSGWETVAKIPVEVRVISEVKGIEP